MSSITEITNSSSYFGDDRFRLLVEAVRDYAIFMLDPEGNVVSWNSGAERIKGYRADEAVGRHFSVFYSPQDIAAGKPEADLEIAAREGRFEEESWRVRKDGSRFWANVVITALKDESGQIYGFGKVTRDLTERRRAEEALRESMEQLKRENEYRSRMERSAREAEASVRELSQRILQLQDDERRRLGRELHDTVGQLLIGAKMELEVANAVPGKTAEAKIDECTRLLDLAIREVRTMSYLLYPPMLEEMGLGTAIEWYLDGFRQRSGIRVDADIPAELERLPRDAELVLFRVLQESLTNVHRHSGSRSAAVRLRIEDQSAILEVKDQGKGMRLTPASGDSEPTRGKFGVGLRGMTERVRQLGGTLEVVSIGKGTSVRTVVPLKARESARSAG